MSIIQRIFKVGQAEANRLVDQIENPEKMLDQAIRDREKEIRNARTAITSVIAQEKETKATLDRALRNKEEWLGKAEMALRAGKEELAAQALVRSEDYEREAQTMDQQWQYLKKETQQLKQSLQQMENDFQALQRERNIIVAQSKAASVKKDIANAKAKIGKGNTDDLIERMRKKAQKVSYEADAANELADETSGDSLEKEFASLETQQVSASVADKLAAMKAKLN